MELSKAKETLIQNIEIDLSERFPEEEKKQFIRMRPMNVKEMVPFSRYQGLMSKGDEEALEKIANAFIEVLPAIIIEHSFYNGDKQATSKQVADFIASETSLFMEIMQMYMKSQSLVKGKDKS